MSYLFLGYILGQISTVLIIALFSGSKDDREDVDE